MGGGVPRDTPYLNIIIITWFLFSFLKMRSCYSVILSDLKLTVWTKLASHVQQPSCLYLPNTDFTGTSQGAPLTLCLCSCWSAV